MRLDDNDLTGIVALMVRLIRVQDMRTTAAAEREAAQQRYAEADEQWRKIRGAFSAFGFDINSKKLWDEIKVAIGADKFTEAFDRARPNEQTRPSEESQSDETEQFDADAAGEGLLRVRDLVLKELRAHQAEGRKAAEIRASVEIILGRELHAKTAGMTLYRLSRDGLARREGRTWFAVQETANPGGETPGSIKSGT